MKIQQNEQVTPEERASAEYANSVKSLKDFAKSNGVTIENCWEERAPGGIVGLYALSHDGRVFCHGFIATPGGERA